MDRMEMMSRDVAGGNVRKIAALFPQCVTERLDKNGKPELAIDFDKLRAELSDEIFSGGGRNATSSLGPTSEPLYASPTSVPQ